jgi:hypothetical protein
MEIIMQTLGIIVLVGIVLLVWFNHATKHYQAQIAAFNAAIDRRIKEKEDERKKIASSVKAMLVDEAKAGSIAIVSRGGEKPRDVQQQQAAQPAVAQSSTEGSVPQKPKSNVVTLEQARGRVIFLGDELDAQRGYAVFTCKVLDPNTGSVATFQGAQLKGEGIKIGDSVLIRRLPSETITKTDGTTRRKNKFQVERTAESEADDGEASSVAMGS